MTANSILTTARLRLRPLVAGDEKALVTALNDINVSRWLTVVPYPYRVADFHDFLTGARPGEAWAIEDSAGFVGVMGNSGALGYWFASESWGRGYATEAAFAVSRTHFIDPAAKSVESGHYVANRRSARVLEKLGFRYVETIERRARSTGATAPFVRVSLGRSDWLAVLRDSSAA